ncbi:hypothetical protein F5888DRAFT_1807846 [Russula emetica]|nr:hypothetical protein F5888DRAFT_1807846 [Russula emetica]
MSPNSSHDIGTPLPSNLSKLNVSQLKALCKERRIVGYSKLGKAALVHKLGELAPSSQSPSSAQTRSTRTQAQTSPLLSESDSSPAQVNDSLAPTAQRPMGMPNTVPGTHIPQSSATSGSGSMPSSLSRDRGQNSDLSASALNVPVSKRIFSEISSEISQGHASASSQQARPLPKKQKVVAVSSPLSARRRAGIPFLTSVGDRGGSVPDSSFSALPGSALVPESKEKEGHQLNGQTQTISMSSKRFKPLEVTRPLPATLGDSNGSRCSQGNKSANVTVLPSLLWHLDFPAPPEPSLLSVITIPPPLSQRKLVQRWAVILSGLSDEERLRCCLVSKLIRYAVYSSAYYKLSRYFSGQRLFLVLQQCNSPLMTNFWPYLRQREQEVLERKNAVMSSFLQPAFRGSSGLISERLWSSPDNEKQILVDTGLVFALHAVEIVKGEIWSVTMRNAISGYQQVFHVLEATCEVLGLAGEQRKANPDNTSPLCDAMRWADHAEFDRGISRHWLSRTAQMGEQGATLRMIAERYTLACVVGNRHHHVESVHLTATGAGRPLHPALAVIQTPAREYYVLRDNGFEVGCEEEGVASVWMRILGCDARGEPVERGAAVSFEELKAYMQNL